ncbi:hypothetical protein [Gelidibacter salicanalis]|uniref:HTH luxR-type domain-containing protein n=1 Tax=Gelidibacter salicanalis TaxID=291193 RepID=A0A934NII4_9FLAO|nr:hypothetical protein [Gelidibacter salicanalis]MBJ7880124.1 hypothetical protein [Gelidibacter salicanalis]
MTILFRNFSNSVTFKFKVCFLSAFCIIASGFSQEVTKPDKYFTEGLQIRSQNPDSAVALFDYSYKKYLQLNDTTNATNSLLEKSMVLENNAKYAQSYDALWSALILIDNTDDARQKSVIYYRLGRIYSYYKRERESIKYLKKALELQKELVKNSDLKPSDLVPYYYSIAVTNRELERKELTKVYLDSSYLYYSNDNKILPYEYLEFEKANLLALNNENQKAIEIMDSIYPWFKENEPTYLVLFYKYLGDVYLNLSLLDESEGYYLKSLKVSEYNKSHIDFTPLVYEKLTQIYVKKNDYKSAFESQGKAKELDSKYFDARGSINQSLLEIRNDYLVEKDRQEKLIQHQYLKQLEQEDKINKLQLIILLGSIVFITIIGFAYFKYLRSRHKIEKELIARNKELEIQKQRELIEMKNKELASSALQLIEKDEFLKDLKSKIRVGSDKIKIHEINKVLRTVSSGNNNNWEEFKLRFIDVNKEFYDKVYEKYPNLSQGDQKICALIKLNLSSKDMARLLGISVESVHTSRHRIRKKMDLARSVNLEDFINSL